MCVCYVKDLSVQVLSVIEYTEILWQAWLEGKGQWFREEVSSSNDDDDTVMMMLN